VAERLAEPDAAGGFLLDGFPRTTAQAEALDQILAARGRQGVRALLLEVGDDEIVERIAGRLTCPSCQYVTHRREGKAEGDPCPRCGTPLTRRPDDDPATVRARLQVYREKTEPLVRYYDERGALRRVDGQGSVEEVFRRLAEAAQS